MLVSSFLHNFLDGLAIGMLFGTGNYASAVTTLIAIIIHEIGHEIGDVSILLS
jgi:zinc transporter ZupT